MSFEMFFQRSFKDFLDEKFPRDAAAAAFFQVREKTVENWRSGANSPSGRHLARALKDDELRPSLIRHLTGGPA
ncbi:MAG: hypothetical protein AAF183_18005 [Pseudomonadota bacterium]